jgi:hypothetical protein
MSTDLLEAPAAAAAAAAEKATADRRRLRLRHHVFFRATEQGVHFDGGNRAFELKGRNLYPLVQRVIAALDAGTELGTLRERLPQAVRGWFDRFIDTLQAHALLLDDRDAPAAPPELAEFVKYLQDQLDPERVLPTWQRWRRATVLLCGRGHALKGALATLLASGAGRVVVGLLAGPGRVDADELHTLAQAWPTSRVEIGQGPAWVAAAEADATLVADDGALAPAELLAPLRAHQPGPASPLALATHWRGHTLALAVPAAAAADALADLAHALQTDADAAPSAAALAIAGTVAAHTLLRHTLGISAPPAHRVYRVSDHLEVQVLARVPAPQRAEPWSPRHTAAPVELASPSAPEFKEYETLRVALLPWLDRTLGAFESADTEGLSQLPLYHETLRLRGEQAAGRRVLAWGLDAREAGRRALAAGFEHHARVARPHQAARIACAFNEADWQRLALARALYDEPGVRAGLHTWRGAAQPLLDGDITLLGSLLGFLAPGPMPWCLQWHAELPLARAWVLAGAHGWASAVQATPRRALREALGQACSRLQTGVPAPRIDEAPAADTDTLPDWDHGETLRPAGVRWHRLGWSELPASVFVGHADTAHGAWRAAR